MRNIYLTAVPLQARFDLEQLDYGSTRPDGRGTPTRFPIIQVIRDTMAPGDEAQVIAIRQENKDTARNYAFLLEELASLGIGEAQVSQLTLPEKQDPATLVGLCRDAADALPQVGRVYACITYGTKTVPVAVLSALRCAEATPHRTGDRRTVLRRGPARGQRHPGGASARSDGPVPAGRTGGRHP